ncbi:FAD/NAD(P)-binding domain-containing protein [Pleurostoma richardsiae]|uniref:FAD/NAD(P)-binding domain-containing protein n=1 Tax=Pleurostoma richardsiae TaxID=41990 RepID=A0AA38RKC6_9PEZI|nr:FAD/NAD(P)-binding domain-containing protein [Pleurostoma richardsiae]
MATPEHFDYVSLGSGEAGKYIAWTLASQHGKRCAVIEREWIGGSCPNVACLPSKNFVHSAALAHDFRQAAAYGLGAFVAGGADAVKADVAAAKHRKADMVDGLVQMHLGKFADTGVELIRGEGRFVGPKIVQVGGRLLTGDAVVVNTGSRAVVDARIPGLVEAKPLTHVEILDLEQLPAHLIILGGGYVGMEFAQAFRRFGSQVTVIEKHDHVLAKEDKDIVDALVEIVAGEGVHFVTSARVEQVTGVSGSTAEFTVKAGGKTSKIAGSHILAAAGRIPNTENIGLEEAGIKLTSSGHVHVDEQLRTTVDGVFAVGDCAGSPHFTHIGFDDFRVVLSYLTGSPRPGGTSGRQVPSTLYTSPELAHVGLREHEAEAQGIRYRLAKLPMAAFLRTRTFGDTRGFAKALVEADGDKILGFTALGPSAGEMLPVVQLAMKLGISYKEIANLIITHPTMCEGLVALFGSI